MNIRALEGRLRVELLALLCAVGALLWFAVLSTYRASFVDDSIGRFVGCTSCFDTSVIANDAYFAAAFMAAVALSRLFRNVLVRIGIVVLVLAGLAAYDTDLVVFRLLTQRLLLTDAIRWAGNDGLMSVLVPWLQRPEAHQLIALTIAAAIAAAIAVLAGPARKSLAIGWAVVCIVTAVTSAAIPRTQYIHNVYLKNLWQANAELDASLPYSTPFQRRLASQPPPAEICEIGERESVSVVLLVVESLSAVHSANIAGLRDDLPNLDALSKDGSYFPEFLSNGFSTETGLIALLTGHAPIPTVGLFGSNMAFTDVEGDFHRWLNGLGFKTAYFTSGVLGAGDKGKWAKAIGISHVEGAENPFYDGMPRGIYGAASDGALVDRFLQWQASLAPSDKFMATIMTVQTHPPYGASGAGSDETSKFREADRQAARLVRTLHERGFFEHGLVIVVGDHRAMTPIDASEMGRLGPNAPVRITAMAFGKTGLPKGIVNGRFQQSDLISSLRYVMDSRSCLTEWQGRFLGPHPTPARYALYANPIERDQVVVDEAGSQYRLLLDGDRTHWITAPRRKEDSDRLRDEINRQRVETMLGYSAHSVSVAQNLQQ